MHCDVKQFRAKNYDINETIMCNSITYLLGQASC